VPALLAIESIVPKWKRAWLNTLPADAPAAPPLPPSDRPAPPAPPLLLPP
jgi:hypothetical protein